MKESKIFRFKLLEETYCEEEKCYKVKMPKDSEILSVKDIDNYDTYDDHDLFIYAICNVKSEFKIRKIYTVVRGNVLFDFKNNYIGNIEEEDDFRHFFDGGWEDDRI